MTNNAIWDDIHAQANNLQNVIDHLYSSAAANLECASAFLDNAKPVVFIGMTSAAYLCHPAEYYLGSQGRIATVMQASDAFYSLLPALEQANIVINSRSGETVEVVKLAKALRRRGVPFLAITNEADSALAKLSAACLATDSRRDDLVSINIITGMMTATLILTAHAVGQGEEVAKQAKGLPALVDQAVRTAWEQSQHLADLFAEINPIYLLYRGAARGPANCGRLALEEIARRPAIALEAAEFRQGPIEVVDKDFGALIFAPAGPQGELNCHLAQDIQSHDGRVLLIGDNEDICPSANLVGFPIPTEAGIFRPVLEVIPTQVLAYQLAVRQGWTPGTVRYISKVITSETGIPAQGTRV